MYTFSLAEAKAQLSKLIELVEGGEQVTITKRGKAVVKIVKSDPLRQQVPSLAEHRAGIRYLGEPAAEFIRKMRDSDRF
ncbi:type II toxin-antitoxin system Phd/YefM family antitoxin [Duganella violaceipulchra]|uniref:Antitoxin n=1 Tax=Duganella violaceipulchra TaxID=2849652 RepID=A0AA41L1K4_9BURK|nr:type II toxin-antitoxin system prevent-host-death family antitoxin [Duganella violaceicalia]MBV6320908.1 type II toxin-antitoxin system prevent-host-death family antitoxin [Duganella violaceicalia]MCP2008381.1 prevent-host-death family protein [Duganella violaceicalia]